MTIEKSPWKPWEEMIRPGKLFTELAFLRPHGRSEDDCYIGVGDYWIFNRADKLSQYYFNTRAQAAQAAYND